LSEKAKKSFMGKFSHNSSSDNILSNIDDVDFDAQSTDMEPPSSAPGSSPPPPPSDSSRSHHDHEKIEIHESDFLGVFLSGISISY
jgi:hypothetical protein